MTFMRHIAPTGSFDTPPLSAATLIGDLMFVSGTPGFHADGQIDEGDFGRQFEQAVAVLTEVLAAGGANLHSLAKVNVILTRASDVAEMNCRYAHLFGPAPYPARTTVVLAALPDPRMLVEIEAIAWAGQVVGASVVTQHA